MTTLNIIAGILNIASSIVLLAILRIAKRSHNKPTYHVDFDAENEFYNDPINRGDQAK